jgi:hypothetical protein
MGVVGAGEDSNPSRPSVAIDRGHRLKTPPNMRDFENRWPTSLPSGGHALPKVEGASPKAGG